MNVKIKWLNDSFAYNTGVTWGVPWKKGVLHREDKLVLTEESGKEIPFETWYTAFWPDGSVKWTAHAASFTGEISSSYYISKQTSSMQSNHIQSNNNHVQDAQAFEPLKISEKEEYIEIDTGNMICHVGKVGKSIIRGIFLDGNMVCSGGSLICIREERNVTSGCRTYKEEDLYSNKHSAVIERSGPVRCVVKVEGKHRLISGAREWLPFTLRLYFYTGQPTVKILYTCFFDGNQYMDFIKGIGMAFIVPMQGPLYNRHIRLAGDKGFFCDSPKNLDTWRTRNKYADMFKEQIEGKYISFDEEADGPFLNLLDESAVWDSFKLVQDSPDFYTIYKRTGEGCCWLKADFGKRAMGLAYAGSEAGGLAVGVKNFWQKYPSALEMDGLSKDESVIRVWFWSPDSNAMDLRHYDTRTHVMSAYEGFDEMRSTPYGIANTSELRIRCFSRTPEFDTLLSMAKECQNPPLLVCEPEYYHSTKVFGIWSLVDKSTPVKARLEKELEEGYEFFINEIEQRKWYGFWDYGDVMRAYDPIRHTWRYDVGGFAWNNNEFDPNIWLWYMFLRTGREDVFWIAEAFTRHASEVDQYHFGEYSGFGSRHNVLHWGCGCKEARISMAGIHRFYYYLTADERVGDILDEVKDVDFNTVNLDPMRARLPKGDFPTHARIGPDWASYTSNWMTRWERFEDESYKEKILAGIRCLSQMPHRMCSGPVFGYDPETGKFIYIGEENGSFHMVNCFGAPVVWFELSNLLNEPVWDEMLAEYGEFYFLEDEEKLKRRPDMTSCKSWGMPESALAFGAFASVVKQDRKLAEKIWNLILNRKYFSTDIRQILREVDTPACPKPVVEIPWANSGMALRYINIILCLELIGKWIPEDREREG